MRVDNFILRSASTLAGGPVRLDLSVAAAISTATIVTPYDVVPGSTLTAIGNAGDGNGVGDGNGNAAGAAGGAAFMSGGGGVTNVWPGIFGRAVVLCDSFFFTDAETGSAARCLSTATLDAYTCLPGGACVSPTTGRVLTNANRLDTTVLITTSPAGDIVARTFAAVDKTAPFYFCWYLLLVLIVMRAISAPLTQKDTAFAIGGGLAYFHTVHDLVAGRGIYFSTVVADVVLAVICSAPIAEALFGSPAPAYRSARVAALLGIGALFPVSVVGIDCMMLIQLGCALSAAAAIRGAPGLFYISAGVWILITVIYPVFVSSLVVISTPTSWLCSAIFTSIILIL